MGGDVAYDEPLTPSLIIFRSLSMQESLNRIMYG